MQATDPFFGTWIFDPAQARYEFGSPPRSGLYRIEPAGEQWQFTAEWTAADGTQHQVTYRSQPDGREHPFENLAMADTLTTTRVDAHTLDTATKLRGEVIAFASRVLAPDGRTMTVVQSGTDLQGRRFSNVSIYVRQG